jgi:hypothetical protein
MVDDNTRVEQFRSEIAEMHLKDPVAGRETNLLRLGVLLMVAGIATTVIAYSASHSTRLDLDQRDDIIIALIGVAVTITGAALFIRYSIAQFFRFWLARLIYEQRAATDRLLAGPAATAAASDGVAAASDGIAAENDGIAAEPAAETPARA